MGKYVNNGKVTLGSQFEYNVAAAEIAELLGVSRRSDGMIHLADICTANGINKWAKNKPFKASQSYFESDTQRNTLRAQRLYGLTPTTEAFDRNGVIKRVSFAKESLEGQWKRIRDFDGYNHYASEGITIANASSYTASDIIPLKVEVPTNDGLGLIDVMEYYSQIISANLVNFQWVLVDPYGFIHWQQTYADWAALKAQLNNSAYTQNLYIPDYRETFGTFFDNLMNTYPYVPPKANGIWTIGLAVVNQVTLPSSQGGGTVNQYTIINPYDYADNRGVVPHERWTFGNFCPDMIVGSCKAGKLPLWHYMYGGKVLECCKDDVLFLGYQISPSTQASLKFDSYARVQISVNVVGQGKCYTVMMYKSDTTPNPIVLQGQYLGSKGEGSGNAWSEGTFYVGLGNLFDKFPNQSELTLEFTIDNYIPNAQEQPVARMTIRNTGEYVSDINPKANVPTSRSSTWYIQA